MLVREQIEAWMQDPVTAAMMDILENKKLAIESDLASGLTLTFIEATTIIKETSLAVGCIQVIELFTSKEGLGRLFDLDLTSNDDGS